MAKPRRSSPRSTSGARGSTGPRRSPRQASRGRGGALPLPRMSLGLSPAVARSLLGILLLVLGAISLIALALPGGA